MLTVKSKRNSLATGNRSNCMSSAPCLMDMLNAAFMAKILI